MLEIILEQGDSYCISVSRDIFNKIINDETKTFKQAILEDVEDKMGWRKYLGVLKYENIITEEEYNDAIQIRK